MRKLAVAVVAAVAFGAVHGEEKCDLSLNPDARDGHTPPNPARYSTVCASERYEAHPTSVMLPDGKTILAFWDVQAAGPCGPAAVSTDAGRTWTRIDERIPAAFAECHDEPKAYRFIDPKTQKPRIRVFASYGTATWASWRGPADRPLAEAMPSILSEDDGQTWKMMPPLGADFACDVCFTGMARLDDGSYLGVFSRGPHPNGGGGPCRVMGSFSRDGGLTWEKPFEIAAGKNRNLIMPTVFRSPDGKELCLIAADNPYKGGFPSFMSFSTDGGRSWTPPRPTAAEIRGFEHAVAHLSDGRLVLVFPHGDGLYGWIGDYAALKSGKAAGGKSVKLCHDYGGMFSSCGSPRVHVRADGEIVVVAHALNNLKHPMPGVLALHFTAEEVDRLIRERAEALTNFEGWNPFAGTAFKPLDHAKFYGPFAQEVVMTDRKERKIRPFDGTKAYITKVAGPNAREVISRNGTYDIAKHADRRAGNAAIVVWTVRVPNDCTARLRLIGSPTARCCVGEKLALPPHCTTIFEPRTAEIALKKGDNDIGVMVYQPQDRTSAEAGFSGLPMRIAAALDLRDFTCVPLEQKIEIKEGEMSIDDALEF